MTAAEPEYPGVIASALATHVLRPIRQKSTRRG